MSELTHFDSKGNARMVDVGAKQTSVREAVARSRVRMLSATAEKILAGSTAKGDVLGVARVAGIAGSKWTPHLIPMCHPLLVDSVSIDFAWDEQIDGNEQTGIRQTNDVGYRELVISARVTTTGKTGVEMEAMTAASITALTVYDMCKSIDREMEVCSVLLAEKKGGKSGHFVRKDLTAED
jgi:cyclic pyranopterin phosphate synthase